MLSKSSIRVKISTAAFLNIAVIFSWQKLWHLKPLLLLLSQDYFS